MKHRRRKSSRKSKMMVKSNPLNPLSTNQKTLYIAAGVVAVAAAGYGAYYLYKRHQVSVAAAGWQKTMTVQPGAKVRLSANSAGYTGQVLTTFLQTAGLLGDANSTTIYQPGQPRPSDWPTDDPGAANKFASEVSVQTTYSGGAPLTNPDPSNVLLWTLVAPLAKA